MRHLMRNIILLCFFELHANLAAFSVSLFCLYLFSYFYILKIIISHDLIKFFCLFFLTLHFRSTLLDGSARSTRALVLILMPIKSPYVLTLMHALSSFYICSRYESLQFLILTTRILLLIFV